jgi:hypothetical protein
MLTATLFAGCRDGSSDPTITGTPAQIATVGRPYTFQPRVTATPGATVRFMIVHKPSWASFDTSTGRLDGTPTANQVGVFPGIQIGATAGTTHQTLPAFSITVAPAPDPAPAPAPAPGTGSAVTLLWQAPLENSNGSTLTNLSGYKIYYGAAPGNYSNAIPVANAGLTTYVVDNLPPGKYYFAVTAYNSAGEESSFSPEVATTVD